MNINGAFPSKFISAPDLQGKGLLKTSVSPLDTISREGLLQYMTSHSTTLQRDKFSWTQASLPIRHAVSVYYLHRR